MRYSFRRARLRYTPVASTSHNLDPSTKSTLVSLSNGNATATFGEALHIIQARGSVPLTGRSYVEFTLNTIASGYVGVGVGAVNLPLDSPNDNPYSAGYYSYDPLIYIGTGSTAAAFGSTFTTGMVIGMDYDAVARTVSFNQNGGSWSTAYSITSIAAELYIFVYQDGGTGNVITVNTGATAFAYTPPSGAVGPDA